MSTETKSDKPPEKRVRGERFAYTKPNEIEILDEAEEEAGEVKTPPPSSKPSA